MYGKFFHPQLPFSDFFDLLYHFSPRFTTLILLRITLILSQGRIVSEPCRKEASSMSTYEELQLIVSIALLIVAILTYTHRK